MAESKLKVALRNSLDGEKIVEIDQTILSRQRRAEIKRTIQKGKPLPNNIPSLTEEFFEGLNIV